VFAVSTIHRSVVQKQQGRLRGYAWAGNHATADVVNWPLAILHAIMASSESIGIGGQEPFLIARQNRSRFCFFFKSSPLTGAGPGGRITASIDISTNRQEATSCRSGTIWPARLSGDRLGFAIVNGESAMGQKFFESDEDYRDRTVREASEQTIRHNTGSEPRQGCGRITGSERFSREYLDSVGRWWRDHYFAVHGANERPGAGAGKSLYLLSVPFGGEQFGNAHQDCAKAHTARHQWKCAPDL